MSAANLASGPDEATFEDFLVVLSSEPLRQLGALVQLGGDSDRLLGVLEHIEFGTGRDQGDGVRFSSPGSPRGWMIPGDSASAD
jgi:hypothetical protein